MTKTRPTLGEFIIDNQQDFPYSTGELSRLIRSIRLAAKVVNHEVNKLNGIVNSKASYENGNAIVEFDKTKTNETEIEKAINSTGYKVTDKKEN